MRRRAVDLLWNRQTSRPRLPLRLVAVFVTVAVLSLGAAVVAPAVRGVLAAGFGLLVPVARATAAARNLVFVATQALAYVGAVYLVGRFVDRRWFRDFGLRLDRDWWVDLGFGLALGAGLMTAVFLTELAAGWVVVTGAFRIEAAAFAFWPWFGWALVTFVGVGVTEELLARGYLIKNAAEGLTWFDRIGETGAVMLAVVASSLLFAVGHATNPNASLASTAGILVAAGMLAAGYVLTGELAIPIGIHVTWNAFQGPVFGFPVSGMDVGLSLLAIQQRGPPLATGGGFGPEAGLLGLAASLLGTAAVLAWVRRREGTLRVHPALAEPALRTE